MSALVFASAPGIGAVLDDAEHAARLEHFVRGRDDVLREAAHHPVVEVAEREHDVDRALRPEDDVVRWVDPQDVDLAVHAGRSRELRVERERVLARLALRHLRIEVGDAELAGVAQQRREDLGVPAGAGPQLDDVALLGDAEERERLLRVAEGVARAILRRALRAAHGPRHARVGGVGRRAEIDVGTVGGFRVLRGGSASTREHDGRGERETNSQGHGLT